MCHCYLFTSLTRSLTKKQWAFTILMRELAQNELEKSHGEGQLQEKIRAVRAQKASWWPYPHHTGEVALAGHHKSTCLPLVADSVLLLELVNNSVIILSVWSLNSVFYNFYQLRFPFLIGCLRLESGSTEIHGQVSSLRLPTFSGQTEPAYFNCMSMRSS